MVAALHGKAGKTGGRGVGWGFGESQEQDQLDVMNAEVGIGTFEAKKVFADGLRLLCVDEPLRDRKRQQCEDGVRSLHRVWPVGLVAGRSI